MVCDEVIWRELRGTFISGAGRTVVNVYFGIEMVGCCLALYMMRHSLRVHNMKLWTEKVFYRKLQLFDVSGMFQGVLCSFSRPLVEANCSVLSIYKLLLSHLAFGLPIMGHLLRYHHIFPSSPNRWREPTRPAKDAMVFFGISM